MLSGMRLALLGLLGSAALFGAEADASPPAKAGKVVRVERRSKRFGGEPRVCSVTTGMVGYCYGSQPQPNDTVSFMDATHTLGQATIDKADPACKGTSNTMWMVHYRTNAAFDFAAGDSATGLLDVTIDPHAAKIVPVDQVPPNRPLEGATGFDVDGDGRRDLEFLAFFCDDRGEYTVPSPSATNIPSTCIEMWYASGQMFERLHADHLSNCY